MQMASLTGSATVATLAGLAALSRSRGTEQLGRPCMSHA